MRIKFYFLLFTLIGFYSSAATYTSVGCPGPVDWSGLNGTCPFFNGGTRLTFQPAANDVLVIPVGCTVTIKASFTINNNIKIDVFGQLRFTGNEKLTMDGCNSVVEIHPGGSIAGSSNSQQVKICGGNDWDGGYGTSYGPFTITQNGNNLPIELLNFSGICQDGSVFLTWSTATEKNNAFFQIERSNNGTEWTEIAKIAGSGTTGSTKHYSFIDKSSESALSYYRLRQVDYNGDFSIYSGVYTDCDFKNINDLILFPNPSAAELNVTVKSSEIADDAILTIINGFGQIVFEKPIHMTGENNQISLTVDLNPGSYHVFVKSEHLLLPGKKLVIIK